MPAEPDPVESPLPIVGGAETPPVPVAMPPLLPLPAEPPLVPPPGYMPPE